MTKKQFKSLSAALVLMSGLISCSKETEVRYQEDRFDPNEIMVEKSDRSFTKLNSLSTMDFTRQLIINDTTTKPENRITNLVLSTTCRSQSEAIANTYISNWPQPTTINILDILPTNTLLQRKIEPIFCDISYTTTNVHNSTETGKSPQVKIINGDSFSNLPLEHILSSQKIIWESSQDVLINPLPGSTGTIVCDDFSYTGENLAETTKLSDVLSQQRILDSHPQSSHQLCRAIFRTSSTVMLSPTFILALPMAQPTIEYNFSKRAANVSLIDSNQTVDYIITNPNPFPVTLKTDLRDKILQFYAVYSGYGFGEKQNGTGPLNALALDWFLDDRPINPVDPEMEIVVHGHSQSRLKGTVRGSMECTRQRAIEARDFGRVLSYNNKKIFLSFMGYNMDLNSDVLFSIKGVDELFVPLPSFYVGTVYPSPSSLIHWDLSLKRANKAPDAPDVGWLIASLLAFGDLMASECH